MSAGWAPGQLSIEQAELPGSMKMTAFWGTVQSSLIEVEAVEVYFSETTRCCIPEGCHLHTYLPLWEPELYQKVVKLPAVLLVRGSDFVERIAMCDYLSSIHLFVQSSISLFIHSSIHPFIHSFYLLIDFFELNSVWLVIKYGAVKHSVRQECHKSGRI
jgi:hypothetical protein